ncbi:hypothetical protein J4474_00945 [Candidatus Pacearchaeota archaeon]|nr:hypothetical protein [Candidatus Pacearchaeota archaeon]
MKSPVIYTFANFYNPEDGKSYDLRLGKRKGRKIGGLKFQIYKEKGVFISNPSNRTVIIDSGIEKISVGSEWTSLIDESTIYLSGKTLLVTIHTRKKRRK